MAYIGKTPTVGNFQKCDAISVVNGQAAYTLQVGGSNVSPESPNHILVSLNGVIQAPTDSYTVSGATLTFASNLATGDSIDFVILLGNVLDLGTPSDNTVTAAKLNNDIISGTTALTSEPASTDELLVSDAGTLKRIDFSLISNTPSFLAYKSSGQTVSNNTTTKVTFDTELFDSDGTFASSRFTPGVAGKYLMTAVVSFTNHPAGAYVGIYPYKNGSSLYSELAYNGTGSDADTRVTATLIVDLDADDYLEIYTRQNAGQDETTRHSYEVRFMAHRIIGA